MSQTSREKLMDEYHELRTKQHQQLRLDCPKCGGFRVKMNLNDCYECQNNECRAVYSTGTEVPGLERVILVNPNSLKDSFEASVLPLPGEGQFLFDPEIAELRERLAALTEDEEK